MKDRKARLQISLGEQRQAADNFPSYCSHSKVWHFWQAGTQASRKMGATECWLCRCVISIYCLDSLKGGKEPKWKKEKGEIKRKRRRKRWTEQRKSVKGRKLFKVLYVRVIFLKMNIMSRNLWVRSGQKETKHVVGSGLFMGLGDSTTVFVSLMLKNSSINSVNTELR